MAWKKKFAVCFTASVDECLNNMGALLGIETVFLSGVHSHDRNIIMKYCVENNIGVYVIPRIGDVIMSGAKQMHMFHLPMLRVSRYSPSPFYLFVKRAFDIVVSGIALIVLSPVFFITAAAVKATDGGPVFYKQQRLTKDGKTFYIHKFRSMRVDAKRTASQGCRLAITMIESHRWGKLSDGLELMNCRSFWILFPATFPS